MSEETKFVLAVLSIAGATWVASFLFFLWLTA